MKISIGLLLIGCNAALGHRLHRRHHHKHPEDNMMLHIDTKTQMYNKLDTHGIFDKAIAKIEKEENDKTDAINLLNELHEKQVQEEKKQSLHQAHLLAAQKEAETMLKSMQSEAEMTAQQKLESIVNDQIKQEDEEKRQKEQEEAGLSKGFLSDANKFAGGDDDATKKDKEAVLHEKVQTVVAPKMAEEALSQALNIKQVNLPAQPAPISVQSIAEMKRNMRNKIAQSVAQTEAKVDVGEGSALEQFDKLKTKSEQPSEEQKEANVDSEAKKQEVDPDQAKLNAAHKSQAAPSQEFQSALNHEIEQDDAVKRDNAEENTKQSRRAPVAPLDDEIENPIAALTALKHPEIMDKAKQFNYEDDMYSHYAGGVSFS